MAMSAERKVGIVVLIGLALLLFGSLMIRDVRLFRRGYPLRAYFKSVAGLERGSAVTIAGVPRGKVHDFIVGPERIEVILWMDEGAVVKEDAVAAIEWQTVLGGKRVGITLGSPEAEGLARDGMVRTIEEPQDPIEQASKLVGHLESIAATFREKVAQPVSLAIEEAKPGVVAAVNNVQDITERIKSGEGTIGKAIASGEFYDKSVEAATVVSSTGNRLNSLLDTHREDIDKFLAGLGKLGEDLEAGNGSLAKLLKEPELHDEALAMVKEVRRASATIADLTPEDKQQIRQAVADISSAARSFVQVMEQITAGQGTIGRLVQSDELYNSIQAAITEGKLAVQDLREQTPVLGFSALVLGALR